MVVHKKLGIFLSGALSAALILGCTGAARAAVSGNVSFNSVSLSINGKTAIAHNQTLTNDSSYEIPASILYLDEAGGGTTYLPLVALPRMLEVPISWDGATDTVRLGRQPSNTDVSFDQQEPDEIWSTAPLHHADAVAGPFTEVEPVWPEEAQITSTYDREHYHSSALPVSDSYYPMADRGQFALSITNHSDLPLRLKLTVPSTLTVDRLPDTVVPAGETVVRTFDVAEYTGYLYPRGISYSLSHDAQALTLDRDIQVTVSAVSFETAG